MRSTAAALVFEHPLHGTRDQVVGLLFVEETDLFVEGGLEEIGVGRLHVLQFATRGADGEDEVQVGLSHQAAQVIDQRARQFLLDFALFEVVEFIEGQQECVVSKRRAQIRSGTGSQNIRDRL